MSSNVAARAPCSTRIAFYYLLFASTWIFLSDRILALALPVESISRLQTVKGIAFVVITTLLLAALLRRAPAADTALTLPRPSRPWGMVAIFATASLLIIAIATMGYQNRKAAVIDEVYKDLRTMTDLKISGIRYWLDQQRMEADELAGNPMIIDLLSRWQQSHDHRLRDQLLAALHQQRLSLGISNLEILDTDGRMLLVDGVDLADSPQLREAVHQVMQQHQTQFIDLYRDGATIRLGFAAPILDPQDTGRVIAITLVEARPEKALYPYLLKLSSARDSGESVLLRRDGNDILLLSDLRHQPGTALRLRVSLNSQRLIAAQFLNGSRGLIRGVDHRGVPVVATAAEVPGTSWVLVSRFDEAEAFAGLDQLALIMGLMLLLVLGVAFALIAFVWQRQRASTAELELARVKALEAAEAHFGVTFETMPLGMAIIARDGRLLRVNQRLCEILHYSSQDLLGRPFRDLVDPADLAITRQLRNNALRALPPDQLVGELRYRDRDGTAEWSEVTVAIVRSPGWRVEHFIVAVQDISVRKQHEEQMRQAAAVFTHTQEGIILTDPQGTVIAANPAVQTITGYSEAELLFNNMRMLQSGRQSAEFYREMWERITSRGYWQGEIWNRHKNGGVYPEWLTISTIRDNAGKIVNYIGTFTDISSEKDFQTQLEYLGGHDALTGLPNRSMLMNQLQVAIARTARDHRCGALLVLDLDRFKNVNDCLGHPVGDELLIAVAQRIRDRLRPADALFRLGGDEFVVLLDDLERAEDVAPVAQSLVETIARPPFMLSAEREACVGVSIGIAIFPSDSQSSHELLQHADSALYRAKDSGRGTYRYYTRELTRTAAGLMQMEAMLRRGLDRQEFMLHYQPLVRVTDARIIGVEALIRWQHPVKGLIPPDQFIPLAEQTGLIVPLGDWILREACSRMQAWRLAGLPLEFIAVNLSPRQFRVDNIDRRIAGLLQETGLPSGCLELEITEGALMSEDGETLDKLMRLRRLGLRLSIDDFGTGYSSLAYLRRFPIDKLKIDRSFVRDLPDDEAAAEIASAIISMGRNLNLEVLAEGVETAAQREFLQQRDCHYAQGYLFSKPLPQKDLERLLNDGLPLAPQASSVDQPQAFESEAAILAQPAGG